MGEKEVVVKEDEEDEEDEDDEDDEDDEVRKTGRSKKKKCNGEKIETPVVDL